MTRDEQDEFRLLVKHLIVPRSIVTTFNGETLPLRLPLALAGSVYLQTEVADENGFLKRAERTTQIEVYEPQPGEKASIYEMGMPVVETGDRWSVNVLQKVPLNMERDNVTPGFLRAVRAEVLNLMSDRLDMQTAAQPWVSAALESDRVTPNTVRAAVTKRFGEKVVINDLSDPEGTKIAITQGYTALHGGTYTAEAWENIKKSDAALPAGQVTPSPKPFDPEGRPLKLVDPKDYTEREHDFVTYATRVALELLGEPTIAVRLTDEESWRSDAAFGPDRVLYMKRRLVASWERGLKDIPPLQADALLLYEFAHAKCADHLSHEFHEEIARLGALLAEKCRKWLL